MVQEERILAKLEAAMDFERSEIMIAFLQSEILKVCGLPQNKPINAKIPLKSQGIESKFAVAFRGRLLEEFGSKCDLHPTVAFDYPTLESLSDYIISQIFK